MVGRVFPLAEPMTYPGLLRSRDTPAMTFFRFELHDFPIPGMSGPRPSTRAFLCDLPCLSADSKVRFLGWCVSEEPA